MDNKNEFKNEGKNIEKLEDANLEEPTGGFFAMYDIMSNNWDRGAAKALGISRDLHELHHNKYYLAGHEIPKKFAKHMIECYKNKDRYNDYEDEVNKFIHFRNMLTLMDTDATAFKFATKRMNEIWRDYD